MPRRSSDAEAQGHQIPLIGATSGTANTQSAEEATPYERIKAMILSNAIPPDTKLTIDQLARDLGVSQTPIREALQRLEGDRLVVSKKPRGIWTTPLLDGRELMHLMEVRLLMEPWAVSVVSTDRAVNPGRKMLAEIERFAHLPNGRHEGYELASHDVAFHDMIFDAVGNGFLHDAFRHLHAHLHLFRLYPADLDGTHTIEEHRAIAEAVHRADPEAAAEAMRHHIFEAMDRFSSGLSTPGGHGRFHDVRTGVLRHPE